MKQWIIKAFPWILLVGLTVMAFFPVFHASYLNWDDPVHFLENPFVVNRSIDAATFFFGTKDSTSGLYIPLTVLSFRWEYLLFGFNPVISHAINLFLHVLVGVAIVFFATGMGLSLRVSFLAALLFAVHPMHVESVAWVTERKDVLYSFFYIWGLVFYVRYLRKGGDLKNYSFAVGCLLLSMLAKPMALSFPFILFLIDRMLARPLTLQSFRDKVPFGLIASGLLYLTYSMNVHKMNTNILESFWVWIWSAGFYIHKFFWPADLSPLYALPPSFSATDPACLWSAAVIVLTLLVLLRYPRGWFAFGFAFYVLSTFFLWSFDRLSFYVVADRFMYLPSLGFCLWVAIFLVRGMEGKGWIRQLSCVMTVAFIAILMFMTFIQTRVWDNSWNYWTRVIQMNPLVQNAYHMRVNCLFNAKVSGTCVEPFEDYLLPRLSFPPVDDEDKALVRRKMELFKTVFAIRSYAMGIKKKPDFADNYSGYGFLLLGMKQYEHALAFFDKVLSLTPGDTIALYNKGSCLMGLNRVEEAELVLQELTRLMPGLYHPRLQLAYVHLVQGKIPEAMDDAEALVRIDPYNPEGYDMFFQAFMHAKKYDYARDLLLLEEKIIPEHPQLLVHREAYRAKVSGH